MGIGEARWFCQESQEAAESEDDEAADDSSDESGATWVLKIVLLLIHLN